jgi:hypothetical protein
MSETNKIKTEEKIELSKEFTVYVKCANCQRALDFERRTAGFGDIIIEVFEHKCS